jgi:hypothetical protein
MKIFVALVIGFASGFGLSHCWNEEREKAVAEDLAAAKEISAKADADLKKDQELAKKIKIARDKLNGLLGIPPQEEDTDPEF